MAVVNLAFAPAFNLAGFSKQAKLKSGQCRRFKKANSSGPNRQILTFAIINHDNDVGRLK